MLPSNKAPGPDGFPGEFYKKIWPLIKSDLFQAVQYFYRTAKLPISWGATHVALIPKLKNPITLKEYRPISICDTKYKIISKMLVMRLKEVLPHIIGKEQGAFIPGRSIHSHLLLVQEMMHSLKYGCGRKALMAAKVDLASAYDSIEWEGLFQILRYFQFPDRWIRWVKACVSTTRVAILVNGTPTEWIPVERGLRQGDPLSPYLFAIVVEALSAKLRIVQRSGRIQLIKAVMSMLPQHLLMAAAMSGKGLGQLEKLMRQFLWIQQSGRKTIHLICWDNVTKPKQEGGLGLQKMKDLRIAILGSPIWKALCKGLETIRKHIRLVSNQLGSIDLIRDPWLSPIPFSRIPTLLNMDFVRLDFRLSDVVIDGE
ncbi:hypothetical protein QJS10_CPB18g01194 [Acorus calamus]|uniref:Reverse transcriptase domain-containing protein n=1 Tax=Acorus calamus TaxID=4465 RepID=A0AAV9CM36_ACOCL|nr:hypothetical protein QJS10_CPB18g01194 [Acorus calamus]